MGIVLTALGNRAWGHGPHWLGLLMMTLGVTISHPTWWFPLYALCLFIWRYSSPEAWNTVGQGGEWFPAIWRGCAIMPLTVVLAFVTHNPYHVLLGWVAAIAVPAAYWLGFKYKKQPGELAEVLAGLVIGLV